MADSHPQQPQPRQQFVTHLASMEQQVGLHVIQALQQANVVAVITTVLPGPHGQSIVSVGLDQDVLEDVRDLLASADQEDLARVPCIGFHCYTPEGALMLPNDGPDEGGDEQPGEQDGGAAANERGDDDANRSQFP